MPSSSVRSYPDPERYETAFVGARVEVLPTQTGSFTARSVRVVFNHLWIALGEESGPCIKHLTQASTRAFVTFLTRPGPEVLIDGLPMPPAGVMRHNQAHTYHERTTGPTFRGAMSLPIEHMAEAAVALAGCDLTPPRDTLRITPPAAAMTKLLGLHSEASALAEAEPAVVTHPEVARSLEQSLIGAMVKCLGDSEPTEETWAHRSHETIMRRFRRVLNENPERALYIPEICAAIGVPDRTLRLCCHEHLGMGPKKYLLLRRLSLAQRALGAAAPDITTVTEIATQYGFWHFGRFSAAYRSVFGELPSVTLNRPPGAKATVIC
jgi:AraC-like DNA-binding protein